MGREEKGRDYLGQWLVGVCFLVCFLRRKGEGLSRPMVSWGLLLSFFFFVHVFVDLCFSGKCWSMAFLPMCLGAMG